MDGELSTWEALIIYSAASTSFLRDGAMEPTATHRRLALTAEGKGQQRLTAACQARRSSAVGSVGPVLSSPYLTHRGRDFAVRAKSGTNRSRAWNACGSYECCAGVD